MAFNNNGTQGGPSYSAPTINSMEETTSSQNGNWPFSVRYTASPYRKAQSGKIGPVSQSSHNGHQGGHGHFDPNQLPGGGGFQPHTSNMNLVNPHGHLVFHHQHHNSQQQQVTYHNHPVTLKQKHFVGENGPQHHFHSSQHHSSTSAAQNHFLDLKQHQEHQQHLIHYRQRQYDHHHYGLPLNLNVAALPPEVLIQASQATLNKTMDIELQQQRFENFQNFQNLECLQQHIHLQQNNCHNGHNSEKGELMSNCYRIGPENHHFRMRYPPVNPRNRVLKLSGNCSSLEQVEGLDEGYIEELKLQPQDNHAIPHHSTAGFQQNQQNFLLQHNQITHSQPQNPHLPQVDPYSYAYDSQTHAIKEDLSVCSASVNSYLNKKAATQQLQQHLQQSGYHPPSPEAFFPYVQHAPSLIPHPRNRSNHSHRSATGEEDGLENEYEEICDVQKYMNIIPSAEFGGELGNSLEFNQPSVEDVTPSTDILINKSHNDDNPVAAGDNSQPKVEGGHSKQASESSLTSPLKNLVVVGPLPPKHFKSFSTSTDDILAEVVQVQKKHDRVLDQLNLEVENLLLNSSNAEFTNFEDKDEAGCDLQEVGNHSIDGSGSPYSTLIVTKDAPPSTINSINGSLPFRSAHSSSAINQHFGTITALGTFSRKNKQACGNWSSGVNCEKLIMNEMKDCCNSVAAETTSKTKVKMNGKCKDVQNRDCSEEMCCGDCGNRGGSKVKGKYQRSMSLIPNWKIRDHLMRLPFLRSNSHQDKVKKSEGLLPHSHSISGGDFPSLQQQQQANNKHANNHHSNKCSMNSPVVTEQQTSAPTPLKNRASSVDELRSTGEEHWYSADSDTELDSLTAIAPLPPAHSPPSDQTAPIFNLSNNNANNPTSDVSVNVNSVNVNLNNVNGVNQNQEKVNLNLNYHLKGKTFPLVQSVGNIYSNCGSSDCNGSRMDVATIGNGISDVPKAPKFRRPVVGLKDKWREPWSSSSANPKTLLKSTSMEEENRLLRWFSFRKNSASANLDNSSGHMTSSNGGHRHSTLPQLTEEDLKRISFMEDEEGYWPRRTVQPPCLPPPPPDLSGDQLTRRHIVAAIVHSENNYVAALQRLVNEYKKPLEHSHPAILSHSKISAVFHRVPEILQCHSLFRIAIAECVRKWDTEEKIGDVFVASFSKSLVLDVYSEFINNFTFALETAKVEARKKSAFAEFLKVKQMTSHDRLSLFGLMVRPVQRFPQFILLLQDLLKNTPKDHKDRMSLQLALTQLESLAAMLNERKRESEQYQAFRETIKSIGGGKFVLLRSIVDDPNRILLRQDLVTQLEFDSYGSTVAKSKTRKLLLLNDMLICTTVSGSSADGHPSTSQSTALSRKGSSEGEPFSNGRRKSEKSVFKWSYPVRDVEVEDISISPTMSRFVQNKNSNSGKTSASHTPITEESSMSITLLEEMQCLMFDYEVLSRILGNVSTLKSSYDGLSVASVKDLMLEIQHQIRCRDEQISYFDSSCLVLCIGVSGHKEKVVFQMQSPQARSAWIEELRLAQLALDPNNSPAWDIPQESPYPLHKLPLFVKAIPLAKQPHLTVVKCGCFFTHTFVSHTGLTKILDYLWTCSTDGISSHLTTFRSQQNVLKEVSSLDLVEEKVNDMLFVQGYIWVGTESRKIMIYDPANTEKGPIAQQILTDAVLKLLLYNNNVFAALADGHLAIFSQLNFEPEFLDKFCPEILLQLGADKIVSIFGSREHVYAACGSTIVTVNSTTFTVERSVTLNNHNGHISHMTCSGVGLWITTHESETVCLYHLESFQHLQDVSIRPSVYRTVRDSFRRSKGVFVTCLVAHKGWLWIGTNLGVILTIPLPRLEGVPIISTGNANVSYHGFCGPVTFLMPLMKCAVPPALLPTSAKKSAEKNSKSVSMKEVDINFDNLQVHNQMQQISDMPQISNDKVEDQLLSSEAKSTDHTSTPPPEPCVTSPLTIEVDVPDKSASPDIGSTNQESNSPMSPPSTNGVNLRSRKRKDRDRGSNSNSHNNSSSSTSSIENSSPSPSAIVQPGASKTLVVLRKKSSKDSLVQMRNCKTLPRGGPMPSNLRFSIDSDVYGLYGNLINVRGLEDEGRFIDPLYDALRRSDPELNSLDAKISTLDRRMKMRMSRPRSLDLSNWSVDSKISASSDDSSVGLSSSKAADFTMHLHTPSDTSPTPPNSRENATEIDSSTAVNGDSGLSANNFPVTSSSTGTTTGRKNRPKTKTGGPQQERTILVVVGGRGYLNMRAMAQEHFISTTDTEAKSCPHLTLWQMKT